MVKKIEIVPQHLFRHEVAKIIPVFGQELVAVHHLNSLALPKPIIDIWVEVENIQKIANLDRFTKITGDVQVDEITRKMINLGYTAHGEQDLAGRRLFSKESDPAATYYIHTYQFGHFQPGLLQDTSSDDILLWLARPRQVEASKVR